MLVDNSTKFEIASWKLLQSKIKDLRKKESELRSRLKDKLFATAPAGTHRVFIGEGANLVCKLAEKMSITSEADMKAVLKKLPRGARKKLIKTSYSIISKGYKELTDKERDIFNECVITKPCAPVLNIEDAKDE